MEALLDVEYIEAVAAPIPLTVINSVSFSLFDWAGLNNDDAPALVQSVLRQRRGAADLGRVHVRLQHAGEFGGCDR